MTDAEFRAWLGREVDAERMTAEQRDDLLQQKRLFDLEASRRDLSSRDDLKGWIVGYVAGERRVAREIHALIDGAKKDYPGRMIYFEPIGFDLY